MGGSEIRHLVCCGSVNRVKTFSRYDCNNTWIFRWNRTECDKFFNTRTYWILKYFGGGGIMKNRMIFPASWRDYPHRDGRCQAELILSSWRFSGFSRMIWSSASESTILDQRPHVIIEANAIQTKFYETSLWYIVINSASDFRIKNIFTCFGGITTQIELVKYKLPN